MEMFITNVQRTKWFGPQLHVVLDPLRERLLKSTEYVVRNGNLYVVILVMVAPFLGLRVILGLLPRLWD